MGRFQVSEMRPWPPRSSHVPERGQTMRTSGQTLELWWMQTWATCFSAAERREGCSLRREEYGACLVSPCRRVAQPRVRSSRYLRWVGRSCLRRSIRVSC
ncbi:hypothetical protein CLIM01_06134 [Colletotrichum limetticola]|nr:hypothetical protein CLIM01_06134 [Colletotrichum limetticola]